MRALFVVVLLLLFLLPAGRGQLQSRDESEEGGGDDDGDDDQECSVTRLELWDALTDAKVADIVGDDDDEQRLCLDGLRRVSIHAVTTGSCPALNFFRGSGLIGVDELAPFFLARNRGSDVFGVEAKSLEGGGVLCAEPRGDQGSNLCVNVRFAFCNQNAAVGDMVFEVVETMSGSKTRLGDGFKICRDTFLSKRSTIVVTPSIPVKSITFAAPGWTFVDTVAPFAIQGDLTRSDLGLGFFIPWESPPFGRATLTALGATNDGRTFTGSVTGSFECDRPTVTVPAPSPDVVRTTADDWF